MMKHGWKALAALLALVLLLGCSALAEEKPDYAELVPESLVFQSDWVAGNFKLDAVAEDGGFRVMIVRSDSLTERTVWEYSPLYSSETASLADSGFGSKLHETLDLYGEVTDTTVEHEDGAAVFSLDENGHLVWKDEKEDAGKGLEFVKIGRFSGTYVCDRAQIEIVWDSETQYSVLIHWAESATVSHDWMMNAVYNAELDALEAMGMESRTEYDANGEIISVEDVNEEGCTALFRFDENGMLRWTGTEGVDSEGMAFEFDMLGSANG